MKHLLLFLLLLCLISCTQYNDIETIVQIQDKNVSSELVEQTRQQLLERLESKGFKDVRVEQGKSPIELVISTKIEADDDSRHQEYHNLFQRGEFGLWYTYSLLSVAWKLEEVPELSEVQGLEPNTLRYPTAVFATLTDNDSLAVVEKRIKKRFAGSKNLRFFWSNKPSAITNTYELYIIDTKGKSTAPITNKHITDAGTDYDGIYKIYLISIRMNDEGTELWANMTREAIKREVAIVIDGRVVSAPTVQSEIANGRTEITGDFTADEATRISDLIKTTPLPYTLKIIDEKITSPE